MTPEFYTAAGTPGRRFDFPGTLDIADGPAALEVTGNVPMMASSGFGDTGAEFFEWECAAVPRLRKPWSAERPWRLLLPRDTCRCSPLGQDPVHRLQ